MTETVNVARLTGRSPDSHAPTRSASVMVGRFVSAAGVSGAIDASHTMTPDTSRTPPPAARRPRAITVGPRASHAISDTATG